MKENESQANDIFAFGCLSNAGNKDCFTHFSAEASFVSRSVQATKQSEATQLFKSHTTKQKDWRMLVETAGVAQVMARKIESSKKKKEKNLFQSIFFSHLNHQANDV